MNIYFSGIGGVGLGPLAEIALDAGYEVVGSDPKESLMVDQLQERGVAVGTDQSGTYLQQSHNNHPIDWFVYTSALPDDHPELVKARQLGIRVSKRDGLLDYIIHDKGLKLIAVAGTHGKTTTSSLLVWTFKQLGIPVSYSIGTTMSFGPSGFYDPKSEYFVYECDEYDRNFLQFHPSQSIITSIGYDHPDTYKTEQDYLDAFDQFISQSDRCLLWQQDFDVAAIHGKATLVHMIDKEAESVRKHIDSIKLPGHHNRENAYLVLTNCINGGLSEDAIRTAIESFPGVDRRFERLANNLYTDYAIHPTEIAATIAMARELNNDVVVVYQPHQNVRQHAVKDMYVDCFEKATEIYWLPTYLTREDASLHVLGPEELTKQLTNRGSVRFAQLDFDLWESIQLARDRGALVLLMGAGNIDGWAREKVAMRHTAGILVIDANGDFVMQHRDDKSDISDPDKLSLFGGRVEPDDHSLLDGAVRELREETNIGFKKESLEYFGYIHRVTEQYSAYYAAYILKNVSTEKLEVYEGQGYEIVDPDAIDHTRTAQIAQQIIDDYDSPTSSSDGFISL